MPLVDFARAAEERAFESLFLPEHTHIPVQQSSPYPKGGSMPERYKYAWDPYTALSFVAASTNLRVGTCVSLPGEHDPIALAKAIATIDVLSGGRIAGLGFGYGWNAQEFADHGYPAAVRRAVVREKVLAMRSLWNDDVASFEGEYVRLSPSWSWPKPMSNPPVLLGGGPGARNFAAIAEIADGWLPQLSNARDALGGHLTELRRVWEAAGRDPASLRIMAMQNVNCAEMFGDFSPAAPIELLRSARGELARVLEHYHRLGVERVVLPMPEDRDEVLLAILDEVEWVTRLEFVKQDVGPLVKEHT
jgi:probable F420-dependent oxidoreductase